MIWSAAKKKIDANATITNTMMVVIMVSRRVGQVTLAVSERTSCRNLNGLKAIAVPRPLGDECHVKGEPDARASQKNYRPNPLFKKEEPEQRARLFGDFIAAPDIHSLKWAGCRWRLCT